MVEVCSISFATEAIAIFGYLEVKFMRCLKALLPRWVLVFALVLQAEVRFRKSRGGRASERDST